MSKVVIYSMPGLIPYCEKTFGTEVFFRAKTEFTYEIEHEERLSEEEIKNTEDLLKAYFRSVLIRSIEEAPDAELMEVIHSITNDNMKERLNQSIDIPGCRILEINTDLQLDEESQRFYEKICTLAEERNKKAKQSTTQEPANLSTSGSALDSIKEKAGKILKFFSK